MLSLVRTMQDIDSTLEGSLQFTHKLDDKYYCSQCRQLLLSNARVTPCGHRLCEGCTKLVEEGGQVAMCPVGEEECAHGADFRTSQDNGIIRDLANMVVYCTNRRYGCDYTMKLRMLRKHLSECKVEPVPCVNATYGCREKVRPSEISQHISTCSYNDSAICDDCGKSVRSMNMEMHRNSECGCTPCPFMCGEQQIHKTQLQLHIDVCPENPNKPCDLKPYGCQFKGKRTDLLKHNTQDASQHVNILLKITKEQTVKLQENENRFHEQNHKFNQLTEAFRKMHVNVQKQNEDLIKHQENMIQQFTLRIVQLENKDRERDAMEAKRAGREDPDLTDAKRVSRGDIDLSRVAKFKGEQFGISDDALSRVSSVSDTAQSRNASKTDVSQSGRERVGLEGRVQRIEQHQDKYKVKDILSDVKSLSRRQQRLVAELDDLRTSLHCVETTDYTGELLWKIPDYTRRVKDAEEGKTKSLFSQPFYTCRTGYKMCVRTYMDGDGTGKGSHVSLFFVIMKGDYDDLLDWPFRYQVTLELIDANGKLQSKKETFSARSSSSSFSKPVNDMNVATGYPQFIQKSELHSYSVGDSLYFRIKVHVPERLEVSSGGSYTRQSSGGTARRDTESSGSVNHTHSIDNKKKKPFKR